MKKLRHPVRSIREPFGTAGLIVAMIALVAALGGTAFAAAKLNGKQKKEVEKIAKKFAGKPGANGTNGTNGTNGKDGAAGGTGPAGKSVVTSAAAVPGECQAGTTGTKFEVEGSGSPSHVCNGKNGTPGAPGSPWTAGGTLPASTEEGCPCTETGHWVISAPAGVKAATAISFPIPLAAPLSNEGCGEEKEPCQVHYIEGAPTAACPGSVEEPKAEPGNLCVYANASIEEPGIGSNFVLATLGLEGTLASGAILLSKEEAKAQFGEGSWAVTGA